MPTFLYVGIGAAVLLVVGVMAVFLSKSGSATPPNINGASNSNSIIASSTAGDRARQVEERIVRGEAIASSDVSGLSLYELRILRNVHFAKYGRKYDQGGQFGSYFYSRPWYTPSDSFSEAMITDVDKANIDVIKAEEDANVAALSRDWETFWTAFKSAAQKRDKSTLRMMMSSDFTYSFGLTGKGDPRDNAFIEWDKPEVNGWAELDKVIAQGTAVDNTYTQTLTRIAPPAAAREEYFDIRALFEQGGDGRWRWTGFVSGD